MPELAGRVGDDVRVLGERALRCGAIEHGLSERAGRHRREVRAPRRLMSAAPASRARALQHVRAARGRCRASMAQQRALGVGA